MDPGAAGLVAFGPEIGVTATVCGLAALGPDALDGGDIGASVTDLAGGGTVGLLGSEGPASNTSGVPSMTGTTSCADSGVAGVVGATSVGVQGGAGALGPKMAEPKVVAASCAIAAVSRGTAELLAPVGTASSSAASSAGPVLGTQTRRGERLASFFFFFFIPGGPGMVASRF